MKRIIFLVIVLIIVGCAQEKIVVEIEPKETPMIEQTPLEICVLACNQTLDSGVDLSLGPCLLDPIQGSDWVCDIAHNPRENIDNIAANQCQSFRQGLAHHFIELTETCSIIRQI